jgi:hypothetical protein
LWRWLADRRKVVCRQPDDRPQEVVLSRTDRRREAKLAGQPWSDVQTAARAEKVALRMSPVEAREQLARWAAQPGRSQADVDALNAGISNGEI